MGCPYQSEAYNGTDTDTEHIHTKTSASTHTYTNTNTKHAHTHRHINTQTHWRADIQTDTRPPRPHRPLVHMVPRNVSNTPGCNNNKIIPSPAWIVFTWKPSPFPSTTWSENLKASFLRWPPQSYRSHASHAQMVSCLPSNSNTKWWHVWATNLTFMVMYTWDPKRHLTNRLQITEN